MSHEPQDSVSSVALDDVAALAVRVPGLVEPMHAVDAFTWDAADARSDDPWAAAEADIDAEDRRRADATTDPLGNVAASAVAVGTASSGVAGAVAPAVPPPVAAADRSPVAELDAGPQGDGPSQELESDLGSTDAIDGADEEQQAGAGSGADSDARAGDPTAAHDDAASVAELNESPEPGDVLALASDEPRDVGDDAVPDQAEPSAAAHARDAVVDAAASAPDEPALAGSDTDEVTLSGPEGAPEPQAHPGPETPEATPSAEIETVSGDVDSLDGDALGGDAPEPAAAQSGPGAQTPEPEGLRPDAPTPISVAELTEEDLTPATGRFVALGAADIDAERETPPPLPVAPDRGDPPAHADRAGATEVRAAHGTPSASGADTPSAAHLANTGGADEDTDDVLALDHSGLIPIDEVSGAVEAVPDAHDARAGTTGEAAALDPDELDLAEVTPPALPPRVAAEGARAAAEVPPTPSAARSPDEVDALMSELVEQAAKPKPEKRRSDQTWWAEVFDESWLRLLPPSFYRRTLREVAFLENQLKLQAPTRVLDVACGFGRHAVELAERGHSVVGVDKSRPLLERGLRELQRRATTADFLLGDMRELSFEREFGAAFCFHTSFGYFDDETNLGVLAAMARALAPGGRLVIEQVSRDWVAATSPHRLWWESDDLIVMEDVTFDHERSRLVVDRSIVAQSSEPWEQRISVRLYGPHELMAMVRMVGLEPDALTGDIAHPGAYLGAGNRAVCVSARKPG
ncbi:MAG: methyltransferase domain-containing protein [Myxococcales bacterium]|nr:methyltransferase domain-containing protein [Myxococcales bacterium]MCB9533299.1 methyltransferase domain-containing protein [Myxococcales bacterium]